MLIRPAVWCKREKNARGLIVKSLTRAWRRKGPRWVILLTLAAPSPYSCEWGKLLCGAFLRWGNIFTTPRAGGILLLRAIYSWIFFRQKFALFFRASEAWLAFFFSRENKLVTSNFGGKLNDAARKLLNWVWKIFKNIKNFMDEACKFVFILKYYVLFIVKWVTLMFTENFVF